MSEYVLIKTKEELDLSLLKKGEIHKVYLQLSDNPFGVPWRIPLIVIRGSGDGPILGVTAALHGNELNGVSTIFKLKQSVHPPMLNGTIVLAPILNVSGYLMDQREFYDGVDLNRIIPGNKDGGTGHRFAHQMTEKLIKKFDYLLDLHTASPGRVNSLYIRSNLDIEMCRNLAYLQNPQIIVKKQDGEGTLRSWANSHGIPAITIEIGNPNTFQPQLIDETLDGILNTLKFFKMIEGEVEDLVENATVCDSSFWIYSNHGGIVEVYPHLTERVKQGQHIATIYDVFGEEKERIYTDREGIVIGKNINPRCDAGSRILHLGHGILDPMPDMIPAHNQ